MSLVISRKPSETLVINGSVRITVARVSGDRVTLSIDAPKDVRVDRLETHEKRQEKAA